MSLPQPEIESDAGPHRRATRPDAPALVVLPRRLTPFLGREALVERVATCIADPETRLLTLTGPGGVGKTRLALRVAELIGPTFPDGIHFVSLAAVVDPALVLPAIGRAIGLADGGDRPISERLADALTGRRTLIVLDNLEQVLPAAREIADLLRATAELSIIATSRAPLHIEGEQELAVSPLALPSKRARGLTAGAESEGVELFVDRARWVQPNFVLTDANVEAVREIVRRLDGLPLALELAAARIKVLTPESLLTRLERQLFVLTGGSQDRPERQRTMRDAIAWSYGLLDAAEQRLFRRLAIFRGGFTLEDADAILAGLEGSDELDILDGVSSLVDQSLLVASDGDEEEHRFRMLGTIREFGMEQLAAAGEMAEVQRRFAAHWTAMGEITWTRTAELETLNRSLRPLEANIDNIRAALDWMEQHDPATAARLAGGLSWFWYLRGHHAEALRRVRRLLAFPESVVPRVLRPRLLLAAGWNAHFQAKTAEAAPYLEEALAIWREQDDKWGIGYTLFSLGVISEDSGDYERARAIFEESVTWLEAAGDAGSLAAARYHQAVVAFGRGELDSADVYLDQVLGDRLGTAVRVAGWALHLRSLLASQRGDLSGALRSAQQALGRFRDARYPSGVTESLAALAVVTGNARLPIAVRLWAIAERMATERGDAFQPPERLVYERAVAILRAQLGPEAFEAERAAGRAWSEDEAVAAALGLTAADLSVATPAPNEPARVVSGPLAALSVREREVLRLVAKGWTNEHIAEELFLSPRTVQTHLTNIYRKIDVDNRTEAVRRAVEFGLT